MDSTVVPLWALEQCAGAILGGTVIHPAPSAVLAISIAYAATNLDSGLGFLYVFQWSGASSGRSQTSAREGRSFAAIGRRDGTEGNVTQQELDEKIK